MIVDAYPGYVLLDVKGKQVEIGGENFLTPQREHGFITSLKWVNNWADGTNISDEDKKEIKTTLIKDFSIKGWILEWL